MWGKRRRTPPLGYFWVRAGDPVEDDVRRGWHPTNNFPFWDGKNGGTEVQNFNGSLESCPFAFPSSLSSRWLVLLSSLRWTARGIARNLSRPRHALETLVIASHPPSLAPFPIARGVSPSLGDRPKRRRASSSRCPLPWPAGAPIRRRKTLDKETEDDSSGQRAMTKPTSRRKKGGPGAGCAGRYESDGCAHHPSRALPRKTS